MICEEQASKLLLLEEVFAIVGGLRHQKDVEALARAVGVVGVEDGA